MTEPTPTPTHPPVSAPTRRRRPWLRWTLILVALGAGGATLWQVVGQKFWQEYQNYVSAARAAEDNAPVGYRGLNYRREYNARPALFFSEKDGRKLLFAARGGDGQPDVFYDITESDADLSGVSGGFGRDSIPGIDYPMVETPDGELGRNLRDRQPVFGADWSQGPRAYPRDLLEKIELVNDVDGDTPIVVVLDRSRDRAFAYRRTPGDGPAITLGTTGYSIRNQPLLYDRKTKSLWAFRGDDLACVCGPSKGQTLPPHKPLTPLDWSDWKARHPQTQVVVGNGRTKPIPAE